MTCEFAFDTPFIRCAFKLLKKPANLGAIVITKGVVLVKVNVNVRTVSVRPYSAIVFIQIQSDVIPYARDLPGFFGPRLA